MSALTTQNLTLQFGGLTAVNDVSLTIMQGEVFSIIGPNGAGKTSLFNAISGVYGVTSGKICICDSEPCLVPSAKTTLWFSLVGLVSGFLALLGFNITGLWQASVSNVFEFGRSFSWLSAIEAGFEFFRNEPASSTFGVFLVGTLLGALSARRFWHASKRGTEVCARYGLSRTFQNVRLFQRATALENVLVGMHADFKSGLFASILRLPSARLENAAAQEKARSLLEFVGLSDCKDRLAGSLPYGSQRKLEIARALASSPKVLLLDEPAAGMNPSESASLMQIIKKIRTRSESATGESTTVVLIEHDMKVVMGISDRIAVLDYGSKIAEGTPEEIRSNPAVIAAYLGAAHSNSNGASK